MQHKIFVFFISFSVAIFYGYGQSLTISEKKVVINNLIKELGRSYVFPDTAKQMEIKLSNAFSNKVYDTISTTTSFAEQLTKDLHTINPDPHLWVRYDPEQENGLLQADKDPQKQEEQRRNFFDRLAPNYGFVKAEVLEGNIGYLDLRIFNPFPQAIQVAIAAMQFVSNTNALIIDLRHNGGGSPEMIKLISSYFFDKPVHLNSFYFKPNNTYSETWTTSEVKGIKYLNKPIYILTSKRTFSAAEEFSYNLKNLKRATIIGEKTRGGANPVSFVPIGEGFVAGIPFGRAINPITKTNWEGTGVQPDVLISEEKALYTAHILSLQTIIMNTTGEQKKRMEDVLKKMQSKL